MIKVFSILLLLVINIFICGDNVQAISNRSDVNQDLNVGTVDAMLVLKKSLGLSMVGSGWVSTPNTGDTDCSSSVTSVDAMFLLRYSIGLSMIGTNWCVEDNDYGSELLTDTVLYWPVPDVTKPDYLSSYVDPIFSTIVTRIVGNPGEAIPNISGEVWPDEQLRHGYSKRQPWNSDESMIFLDRISPDVWLDGETYEVLFTRNKPGSRVRWSMTESEYMYYVDASSKAIGKWHVVNDTTTQVVDLSGYDDITFGKGEGNFTWDGEKVAIIAKRDSDSHEVVFIVNVKTGVKEPDIDMDGIVDEVNNCTISPLGNYIVASTDISGNNDILMIIDANSRAITLIETDRGIPSHFDVQIDQDGDEIVAGVAKTEVTRNGVFVESGTIIKRKLLTGEMSVISDKRYASHTSGRSINESGWVYVTYHNRNPSYPPYVGEVVKVKLDGTEIRRVASLHAIKFDYYSEPHAVPSPSGSRVMWASDWENNDYPVQAYVADYR